MELVSPGVAHVRLGTDSPNVAYELARAGVKYIHLDRSIKSVTRNSAFIHEGVEDKSIRSWLVEMARNGYFVYLSDDRHARFCHQDRLRHIWQAHTKGDLSISDEGVFYNLERGDEHVGPEHVVVIFSAIGNEMFTSSLNRYFVRNYRHLGSAIPRKDWVVRIPDVGGVLGSFYLPTTHDPQNADRIHSLLTEIINRANVAPRNMILVGSSKGATGATYHAHQLGASLVSVDPILSDRYYVEEQKDCHFTEGGVFLESKESVFARLRRQPVDSSSRRFAVTSEHSPQFTKVREFFDSTGTPILTCNSPDIRDHPDVAKVTHRVVMSLVTAMTCGLPLPAQSTTIN
ncbi:XcbB/CpsF family capsular polysaccharide biosynthesis protein [Brevibacterium sp. 1718]|uniref:XcbB/CpsF family capsular polysaccharide biosynthesis protein n=1 Tax=Brevibacterium sp. 1718 TaxID=3413510 RepID=UPI003DA7F5EC